MWTCNFNCVTVIEEFSKWIEDRKEGYKEFLVPDLKLAAFKLVRQKHMKQMLLIKNISAIYDFVEHKDIFLPTIKVCYQRYNIDNRIDLNKCYLLTINLKLALINQFA